jgi:hypothetical protein
MEIRLALFHSQFKNSSVSRPLLSRFKSPDPFIVQTSRVEKAAVFPR